MARTFVLAPVPSLLPGAAPFSVSAEVRNADNSLAVAANGPATIRIASGPSGAALSGTLTRNVVAGVVTFDGITVNRSGAYTFAVDAQGYLLGLDPAGGHTIDADTVVRVRFYNNGSGRTVPVDEGPNAVPLSMAGATNLAYVESAIGAIHNPTSGTGKFPGPTVYAQASIADSAASRAGLLGEMTMGFSLVVPTFSKTFGDIASFFGGVGRFVAYLWRNDGVQYKIDWYYDTGQTPSTCGTGTFDIPNNTPIRVLFVRRSDGAGGYECCGFVNGVLIRKNGYNSGNHQVLPLTDRYTNGRWRLGTFQADANTAIVDMAEFFVSKRGYTDAEALADAQNCGLIA